MAGKIPERSGSCLSHARGIHPMDAVVLRGGEDQSARCAAGRFPVDTPGNRGQSRRIPQPSSPASPPQAGTPPPAAPPQTTEAPDSPALADTASQSKWRTWPSPSPHPAAVLTPAPKQERPTASRATARHPSCRRI